VLGASIYYNLGCSKGQQYEIRKESRRRKKRRRRNEMVDEIADKQMKYQY